MARDRYDVHHIGAGAAVGPGASGSNTVSRPGAAADKAEIDRLLRELQGILQAHKDQLAEPLEAREALDDAVTAVRADQPKQARRFLAAVVAAAGQVTAVTSAVQAIRELLG